MSHKVRPFMARLKPRLKRHHSQVDEQIKETTQRRHQAWLKQRETTAKPTARYKPGPMPVKVPTRGFYR